MIGQSHPFFEVMIQAAWIAGIVVTVMFLNEWRRS